MGEVEKLKTSWHRCEEVYYTSAKTNKDVSEAFQHLCRASRAWLADKRTVRQSSSERSSVRAPLSYNAAGSFHSSGDCNERCCKCFCRSGRNAERESDRD